jgi:hypothetical protein
MITSTDAKHRLFVCWALRDPDDADEVRRIADAVAAQKDIPGVLSIDHGPRTRQVDWEGPSTDFDYAMSLTFDTFDSVRAYPPHPIHAKLVALILELGSDIRGHWFDV